MDGEVRGVYNGVQLSLVDTIRMLNVNFADGKLCSLYRHGRSVASPCNP